MSILGGILLTLFAPAIISRMRDGIFKVIITFLIPFIGYEAISETFGIFLLGICLFFGLGSPMPPDNVVDVSKLRRDFGKVFDLIAFILIIISIIMFIFSFIK